MGKITGFIDTPRKTSAEAEPLARLANFNEFHDWLPRAEQQAQAGRCMDCGVPFCQAGLTLGGAASGCPLHNLPYAAFPASRPTGGLPTSGSTPSGLSFITVNRPKTVDRRYPSRRNRHPPSGRRT